jgi:Domain of unknown function (DUF5753)/Helix-turn-helix domain
VTTASGEGGSAGGPTVLRMILGGHLRRLREARGITRDVAGWEIRASESKISRMELGRVGFKERDVADLLTLYGVADENERSRLLALARDSNAQGWWHRYGDAIPNWFQSYLGLEANSSMIRSYEVQFVPGLLQTKDYARAVVTLGHGRADPDEIERRVALRMARQQLLTRPEPPAPLLWAVVDEAALRRSIGGPKVMRVQLEALIEATHQPNVRLQVAGFHMGGHPAAGGAFTILRFPDEDLADVVFVEQLNSGLYFEKSNEADEYAEVIERLSIEADPPSRTEEILRTILDDLDERG